MLLQARTPLLELILVVLAAFQGRALAESATGGAHGGTGESPAGLIREHRSLLSRVASQRRMSTPYVIIDTRANLLLVRDTDHQVEHRAVCSTGAARRFEGRKSWHKWVFATPTGRFRVLRKVEDPLWTRPSWHFLESGEEVPIFAEDRRRFQRGVLGRYALYFLPEYMIHGTLYETNLGRNITHGCVRVGDEDLSYLFERVQTGWPVFAF